MAETLPTGGTNASNSLGTLAVLYDKTRQTLDRQMELSESLTNRAQRHRAETAGPRIQPLPGAPR
jgi:hypothetical protein